MRAGSTPISPHPGPLPRERESLAPVGLGCAEVSLLCGGLPREREVSFGWRSRTSGGLPRERESSCRPRLRVGLEVRARPALDTGVSLERGSGKRSRVNVKRLRFPLLGERVRVRGNLPHSAPLHRLGMRTHRAGSPRLPLTRYGGLPVGARHVVPLHRSGCGEARRAWLLRASQ